MIGIDFGTKRVGIAVRVENIAIPYSVVERHKIMHELKKIIKERGVKTIVLGNPLNMDGSLSEMSKKVINFSEKLKNIFPDLEIVLIDERLSSFEARSLVGDKIGQKDAIAASIILSSYISKIQKYV